MFETKSSYIM